jgi:hypothetical protein
MLKAARGFKPQVVVVQGDLADCYAVSSHSKDPRRIADLEEEVENVKAGLDELDALKAKEKIFIEGNHCDRLRRYLSDKAPQLFGTVSIPKIFGLKDRGWKYIPYKSDTRLGKLYLTHDVGVAGRFAAYKALDTYQHSCATAHTHRISYLVEGNAAGEYKVSATFGWLGDVAQVDYMCAVRARKDWALGFGIGYLDDKSGIVYLTPIPIVKYRCVVEGKLYTG